MIKAILLDIEGTTTPIDFVHKTLFPFSKERIGDFVRKNFSQINEEVSALETEYAVDTSYSDNFDKTSPESVAKYLRHLIDVDRKSIPLKSLQGKIWEQGYESGALKSLVYDDVPLAFERWKSQGKTIAIYSSGSVLAQKLLFRYTDHGDLTPNISAYFDTNIGKKQENDSYKKIAEQLDLDANEILFISDVAEELDAAKASGLETALIVRGTDANVGDHHPVIKDFGELDDEII